MGWPPRGQGTWIVDLDGVVWLAGRPIDAAGQAIERLRDAGARVLFATNNSAPTLDDLTERLSRAGVPADVDDIVTSSQAAAGMIDAGSRVLTLAGNGVREALAHRGVQLVGSGPADAVVVGWTDTFDYGRLAIASSAVRDGARLIGTNEDATYPGPDGLLPGGGALLAAVATASGVRPEVAGKPHKPLVELLQHRAPDASVVVGDRPSTDGVLAQRLGVPYALVLSGVTAPGSPRPEPAPDATASSLRELVDRYLSS